MAIEHNKAILPSSLLTASETAESCRLEASRKLDSKKKVEFGQFLTPLPIARLLVSFLERVPASTRLLDPGAGVGSLTAAFVDEVISRVEPPRTIAVVAYEIDAELCPYLEKTLLACKATCARRHIEFSFDIRQQDFIQASCLSEQNSLFLREEAPYDCIIMNPPYRKLGTDSVQAHMLRLAGAESTNLYAAFMWLASRRLCKGGQFISITPRSFCNGPYFAPFRADFLERMALKRLHVFEKRDSAFRDDEVLQENLILHAVKDGEKGTVIVSSTADRFGEIATSRTVASTDIVASSSGHVIHIPLDELDLQIAEQMRAFEHTLKSLGLEVSTGRVVDFRAKLYLSFECSLDDVPLIYPHHLVHGFVKWPNGNGKKPSAIMVNSITKSLLVPKGTYVVIKRFSSKEEARRVVAAVLDSTEFGEGDIGIENHLNYLHCSGAGIERDLAFGLTAFLNSSLFDAYFRQFSGHTQVNATDLRRLRYPSRSELLELGARVKGTFPVQAVLDDLCEEVVGTVGKSEGANARKAVKKIRQALKVLKDLDLPREQQNERSALTLLALLGLTPSIPWSRATRPLVGITEMMGFFSTHYGKQYAPNTRETVRRFTAHQFMDAGLIVANPDKPDRAINSPKWCYQITEEAHKLLCTLEDEAWEVRVTSYIAKAGSLRELYAQERLVQRIPVNLNKGEVITLSPGGQNVLIKKIIDDFCPHFVPNGTVLYVGDTDTKWAFLRKEALEGLGVKINAHGKFPDVIVRDEGRNWLFLIEAVTSHGPVNPKRMAELKKVFKNCSIGLVYVTAFLNRRTLGTYLGDLSWETEVWVADSPSHLIHFDGERFLGPYS